MPDTVQTVATAVSIVPGVGTVASTIITQVATTVKMIGGLFRGSPPVEWEQSNSIAVPVATKLVTNLSNTLGVSKLQSIFDSYTVKLKDYIAHSPHNPTQTKNFVDAINREAISMQPGFRFDAFPFDVPVQNQLAWAIWLHTIWLFGGVSQNEVGKGGAMEKFQASLEPTLVAAVAEATGTVVNVSGATETTTTTTIKSAESSLASISSNKYMMIALIGAALGLLYFSAKGK